MSEQTREKWLLNLAQQMERHLFRSLGYKMPKYRVSCSWPGGGSPRTRIGECWGSFSSEDGTYEMFISPELSEEMRVSDVLAHEMCHAVVGLACGHKGPFVKIVKEIGLIGKPTATEAGPEFIEAVEPILARMGPYPHATLRPISKKKSTQRLLKLTCKNEECPAQDDIVAYSNKKQLDTYGAPCCPECLQPMEEVQK